MMLLVIILLTVALFWVLAVKTDILRDPNSCSDGKNTFSLARTQFGIWTVIVFCSFVYLLTEIDKDQIELTEDVAILFGISVGTTVVSRSIDKNAKTPPVKNLTEDGRSSCSKGFLIDILSDGSGISVHRFQQVLFTLLLIYVFIVCLLENKNFPDLDNKLLLLSGISSGGYLGVKISE